MISDKEKEDIIDNILFQAKHFLEAANSFYPFGTIINSNDEMKPLGLQMEEEYPSKNAMVDILTDAVIERLRAKEYKYAAIGIDVLVTENDEKVDAIEIRLFESEDSLNKIYYKYSKAGTTYAFELI